ncbi:hypothetical protein [Paenibacillus sp. FJAT-26967]|uniref:hypothetical protein n=1 Tax=Paenibacillus sp. FJAT-26967 TaxID=1729690 RepID=UPI00155FCFBC|nr:hypothetical protein [Paenibacillus sp. FJAT-26967]
MSMVLGMLYLPSIKGQGAFSYEFLAHELGSERESVSLWAMVSIALGLIMACGIVYLLLSGYLKHAVIVVMTLTVSALVIIQMPPVFLWGMVLPFNGSAFLPIALHGCVLLGGIWSVGVFSALYRISKL